MLHELPSSADAGGTGNSRPHRDWNAVFAAASLVGAKEEKPHTWHRQMDTTRSIRGAERGSGTERKPETRLN